MLRRRITVALSVLAAVVVLQGLGAAIALGVAEQHLLRGRVASDIQLGFVELSVTKQRLRNWVAQRQQGAGADPAVRDALQADMRATLRRLNELSARAARLGSEGATNAEHIQRQDALAVLTDGMARLEQEVNRAQPLLEGADAREAWDALSNVFDVSNGRDVRRLITDSIAREATAVQRERAAADETLAWMRSFWLGAALTLALAALLAALYFARALRRPLGELSAGARALQAGQLQHRIPLDGSDEFAVVARSVNAMAAELEQHRTREAAQRQRLEELVSARTAQLQSALEALRQTDTRRRQLFADISHELRTPTTAIRGEAEITLRGRDRPTDEYKAALGRIVAISHQLGGVIDDLLAMARSDLDALSLVKRPLDLAAPVSDALAQASALAATRDVRLESAAPAQPLPVMGDAQRLRQLLLVLLDNAVRYSHPGGSVRVALRTEPGTDGAAGVAVEVQDEGIGIAEAELPQVFERHFRGEAARRHRADGGGLGLPIARALAQAHGGRIDLASRPGSGTQALLWLPLVSAPTAPGEPA